MSTSKDAATHGQKLYSLFVKEKPPGFPEQLDSYTQKDTANPIGQVIVKEGWIAEEVNDDGNLLELREPVRRRIKVVRGNTVEEQVDVFLPYARKGDHLYHATRRGDLFIMFKLDPQTPGTDNGWVYGTVTPDGQHVTSAGRVESCMACHVKAPCDRLFGVRCSHPIIERPAEGQQCYSEESK